MSAHFTLTVDQSSGLVRWSPDGRLIATAVGHRLIVRSSDDIQLDIVRGGLRPCLDKIEGLEWASDSDLVLCGVFRKSMVEVFSVSRPEWRCRIREGLAGMVRAQWAPDDRHVITFSDFGLHMSIWSLSTRQVYTIRQPKTAPGCVAFSRDSRLMAVATRRDCRDHVRLLDAVTWQQEVDFVADTLDLCSLEWSPDGRALCLLDNCLEYRVLFYSPTGELLGRFEPYKNALGARSLSWSPKGNLLAVGGYDQSARLVSPLTWDEVAVLRHVQPKGQECEVIACYEEVPVGEETDYPHEHGGCGDGVGAGGNSRKSASRRPGRWPGLHGSTKTRMSDKDVQITYVPFLRGAIQSERPDHNKPNPRLGVGQILSWSHDGRFLVTRNDNMPTALWIWEVNELSMFSVVVQMKSVKSAKWCPTRNILAICTGLHHVYLWNPEGASWVDIPGGDLGIVGLRWSASGDALILLSKTKLCCCFLSQGNRGPAEDGSSNGDDTEEAGEGICSVDGSDASGGDDGGFGADIGRFGEGLPAS